MLQSLFAEKDQGLKMLNKTVESGEKLFPDTAVSGREKIRQELRNAKDDWDQLFSNLTHSEHKVETFLHQWSSYSDGQEQLMKWMTSVESGLETKVELKNTLQEKKAQLQHYKVEILTCLH